MSTERQQYSLANQSENIQQYAEYHGYSIVQTYSDEARTGVLFRKRKGLQQLIHDVVQGQTRYKAILVYDVSRWGRSQDIDEAAYYEFLCKSAGIPVEYCAEPFSNDGGLSSLIMKSLKRVMAGEYSRELGVKIFAAQKRLAQLGYRQGGQPGYGLRRLLISADGTPKQLLAHGERKSIANDRVIQVPGPEDEVRCVREIYRLYLELGMSFWAIARELNRRKIPFMYDHDWRPRDVSKILTTPKYAGFNVYGRTSLRLYTPPIRTPESEWIVRPSAFEPLVSNDVYAEVQKKIASRSENKSNEQLLADLRELLSKHGRLTASLVIKAPNVAAPATYRARFGGLHRAYALVGYQSFNTEDWVQQRRKVFALRGKLLEDIAAANAGVTVENRGSAFRPRLRLPNGRLISVVVVRQAASQSDFKRWRTRPIKEDRRLTTLVALVNKENTAFETMYVVPALKRGVVITWTDVSFEIRHAVPLKRLSDFVRVAKRVSNFSSPADDDARAERLSAKRRKEVSRKALWTRWHKQKDDT